MARKEVLLAYADDMVLFLENKYSLRSQQKNSQIRINIKINIEETEYMVVQVQIHDNSRNKWLEVKYYNFRRVNSSTFQMPRCHINAKERSNILNKNENPSW